MKKVYKYLLLVFMAVLPCHSWAQEELDDDESAVAQEQARHLRMSQDKKTYKTITIKGQTIDQGTGLPVSGIQIQALGNRRYSAMSDDKGLFNIKVPVSATALYVHAPEYLSLQVALPRDTVQLLTIRVMSDRYRTMYTEETPVKASTGFTSYHTSGMTIENEIAERLGGDVRTVMHNGTPGAGAMMLIRGIGSLNTDAQPLIVIDGIEQDMQRMRPALHLGQFINILANLSPDDIDKVEVLKNATALYGARGANGVILITTKRGHSQATRIDANISVGVTTIPDAPKMMDASQYRLYAMEMIGKMAGASPLASYTFLNDNPDGFYYHTYHNNTDWGDYIYRKALLQQYSINVQGGDDIGMYNLSVGYSDAESTLQKNGMNRMNARFNSDINILWNLSARFDISISRTQADVFDDGVPQDLTTATITSPRFLSMIKSPLVSPYQYNAIIGGFSSLLSEEDDLFGQLGRQYSLANPVAILENGKDDNKNRAENTFFNVRLEPTLQVSRYWKITELFSYSLDRMSQRYFRPYSGVPSFEIAEMGTVTSQTGSLFSKEINVLSNTYVQYERQLENHALKAVGGFRYNYFSYDNNNLSTQYQSETNDKNPALSASTGYQMTEGIEDVWKNLQMYVSVDYNYQQRYFFTLSFMGEANSRFGENADGLKLLGVRWALFPSIQTGWVLTNERWFPRTRLLNYLRLNAGYDLSGNDNISNYAARTSLSSVIYNYNAIGLKLTNIGNDEILWETTRKLNIGMEANMLDNRLSVGFDYYLHRTSNLLTMKSFDNPIGGINRYWTNDGALRNEGFEAKVAFKPVVMKDFMVEMGASVGRYKNTVTSLPDGNYTSSIYGTDNILTQVGGPVGLFYGYETQGVFSTEAEASKVTERGYLYMKDKAGNRHKFQAGDVHFTDMNGDGMINEEDKVVIGNPNPDIYGNLFATIGWRNLTLYMNFSYSLGNDLYNYQRSVLNAGAGFYNQQVQTISHWRYEGQQTEQPRLSYGDPLGNNRMSDRWIEDGSYLRLKSLRLAYRVPVPVSWTWLQGLSLWAEAQNLLTITRYTGSDPEFSAASHVLWQGIDAGQLPQSKSFTMGVKMNL